MSVFTPLTEDAVDNLTKLFGLDSPLRFEGITSGTVNSNFCLYYPQRQLILTVFEQLSGHSVDNYMRLQDFLAKQHFPCPQPLLTPQQKWHALYQGKPVTLISFIPGQSASQPSATQCEQIGLTLAKLHQQTANYPKLPNPLGSKWREEALSKVLPTLSSNEQELMHKMHKLEQDWFNADLPTAIIHNDCFKDNVHFAEEQLTGIIDFYYAATEVCLWDVCVVANDWCTEQTFPALLKGYQSVRPFTDPEQKLLPQGLAIAAWHFWLYRLYVNLNRPTGSMISRKDPNEFARLLEQRLGAL